MQPTEATQPGQASEAEHQLLTELEREALRSEQLRALILTVAAAIAALSFFLMHLLFATQLTLLRLHPEFGLRVVYTMLPLGLYELLVYGMLSRLLRSPRPTRWLLHGRYLSAVLELLVPSALVYGFIVSMNSVNALLMPPASLYYIFILLSALRFEPWLSLVTGLAAAGQYLALYAYAYSLPYDQAADPLLRTPFHHGIRALGFVICGVLAGILTAVLRRRVVRSLRLVAERNRVTSMFGLYVTPSVVDRLMTQSADVDGEMRSVCVLFLDIRNFTQFAEKRSPQQVVQFLNSLFAPMIETVSQHGGIINKFLGDGFMAMFGAPLPDERACQNAIAASRKILRQLAERVADGQLPATRIGIGIHYGPVLTGSIGSERRKEYTIIGDTVNLAARIEQLTKQYDAQLLVSHSVMAELPSAEKTGERIGEVAVRGRQAGLDLYKLD
ncbi:MAG TPA: adenylate/guanylate cyclase domain-containing protein [Pseudomonadota bacterium]|nr:adenylate/guanylate cyclase domain-containing protein [Pseudomonadota bacterium]